MKSKEAEYKQLVGANVGMLKILSLEKIKGRKKYKTICGYCKDVFFPRAEAVLAGRTKSCGCKRYDFVSDSNKKDETLVNTLFQRYKNNAAIRNLSFSLSKQLFAKLIFAPCSYCGSTPSLSRIRKAKKGKRRDQYLKYNGIDRINSMKGYSKSNCATSCSICNRAKSNITVEEFTNWIQKLIIFQSQKPIV